MSWTVTTAARPTHAVASNDSLFASYEAIATLSAEMVVAAEMGDWDGVSALERECAVYMERLGHARPCRTKNCNASAT